MIKVTKETVKETWELFKRKSVSAIATVGLTLTILPDFNQNILDYLDHTPTLAWTKPMIQVGLAMLILRRRVRLSLGKDAP